MAKRKKYKEAASRLFYDKEGLNKTVFNFVRSWKEMDKELEKLSQKIQEKRAKRQKP